MSHVLVTCHLGRDRFIIVFQLNHKQSQSDALQVTEAQALRGGTDFAHEGADHVPRRRRPCATEAPNSLTEASHLPTAKALASSRRRRPLTF